MTISPDFQGQPTVIPCTDDVAVTHAPGNQITSESSREVIQSEIKYLLNIIANENEIVASPGARKIFDLLNRLIDVIMEGNIDDLRQKEVWTDDSGMNLLHLLCRLSYRFDLSDLIKKSINLCPSLFNVPDLQGKYAIEYVYEHSADELMKHLVSVPFPGEKEASNLLAHKWLTFLCKLSSYEYAFSYAQHAPHAFLPIEFSDIDKIKSEGKIIYEHLPNLLFSVINQRNPSESIINRFLSIWDATMKEKTGIASGFFQIFLNTLIAVTPIFESNELVKNICTNIGRLCTFIVDTIPAAPTPQLLIRKIHSIFIYARSPKSSINILRLVFKCLRKLKTAREKDYFLNGQASIIINLNLSRYEHDENYVHEILTEIIKNNPAPYLRNLAFSYFSINKFTPKIKELLDECIRTTGNLTVPVMVKVTAGEALKVLKSIEKKENEDPQFKEILSNYLCFENIYDAALSTSDGLFAELIDYCLRNNFPFYISPEVDNSPSHIKTLFSRFGYYFRSKAGDLPDGCEEPLEITKKTFEATASGKNIDSSEPTVLTSSSPGLESLNPATSVEVEFNPFSNLLEVTVKREDKSYPFWGVFSEEGLKAFVLKIDQTIDENLNFGNIDDPVLSYGLGKIQEPNSNPNMIEPAVSVYRQKKFGDALPICFYVNEVEQKILSRRAEVNTREFVVNIHHGLVFDLRRLMEIELRYCEINNTRFLNKVEVMRNIFESYPEVCFWPHKTCSTLANHLHHELDLVLTLNPHSMVILGDVFNDRYIAGWLTPQGTQKMVLSKGVENIKKEMSLLCELRDLLGSRTTHPDLFTSYTIQTTNGLIHHEQAPLTFEEVTHSFDDLMKKKEFDEYAAKYKLTVLEVRNRFLALSKALLDGTRYPGINEAKKNALKILFTQTFHHIKETKSAKELVKYITILDYHNRHCDTGLTEELWQQYYFIFPSAIRTIEADHFQKAITRSMFNLVDQLKSFAIHPMAKLQSAHYHNFLKQSLPSFPIPEDPNTLNSSDFSSDQYANTGTVGDDYEIASLPSVARSLLIPTTVLSFIQYWRSSLSAKKGTDNHYYVPMAREFVRIERTPPLSATEKELECELQELRKLAEVKEKELATLYENKLWKIYSATLARFNQMARSHLRKRERASEIAASHDLSIKRSRTMKGISPQTGSSSSAAPTNDDDVTNQSERLIAVMKENETIKNILAKQKELESIKDAITSKSRAIQTIYETYGNELSLRGELSDQDELTLFQDLTVAGALTWLESRNILHTINPAPLAPIFSSDDPAPPTQSANN